MTATLQSIPRQRLYERGLCFAGPANHIGVPILRLNGAGEPITVALVCLQGEGNAAEAIAAATATAAVMAQAANLLELLEGSWGFLNDGMTSGDRMAAINRAIAAAHAPASPFASLQARAHQRAAEALGEGSAP